MVHCMPGWVWWRERDMQVWDLGGRPDLLLENEGDALIDDYEFAETSGQSR